MPDPGSWIPDPTTTKQDGEKICGLIGTFFVATFTKVKKKLVFQHVQQKNLSQLTKNHNTFYPKTVTYVALRNTDGWFRLRYPGSRIWEKAIPDPGVKKSRIRIDLTQGRQKCGKEQREGHHDLKSSYGTFRGNSRDTNVINYFCEHFVKKRKKILQNGSVFIRKSFLYSAITIGIPEAE